MIACCTQVAPGTLGAFDQIAARGLAEFNPDSVEEIFVCDPKTKLAQTFREFSSEIVDALGNSAQSLWSVINRIHRGDHSSQDLGSADVAGGFVGPDVLLACLQRQSRGRTSFSVVGDADEPAGKVTFELITCRDVSRVRTAKAKRNTA